MMSEKTLSQAGGRPAYDDREPRAEQPSAAGMCEDCVFLKTSYCKAGKTVLDVAYSDRKWVSCAGLSGERYNYSFMR